MSEISSEERYAKLFELVKKGYKYNRTAPKWNNGRGYFYLIHPNTNNKRSVIITCSRDEFEELKEDVERIMLARDNYKYYTKKREARIRETEETPEVIRRLYKESITKHINMIEERSMEFLNFLLDLGWLCFPLLSKINIPAHMRANPPKNQDFVLKKFAEYIDDLVEHSNPEHIKKLRNENDSLKVEIEQLKKVIEEKEKTNKIYNEIFNFLVSILRNDQKNRLTQYLIVRYGKANIFGQLKP